MTHMYQTTNFTHSLGPMLILSSHLHLYFRSSKWYFLRTFSPNFLVRKLEDQTLKWRVGNNFILYYDLERFVSHIWQAVFHIYDTTPNSLSYMTLHQAVFHIYDNTPSAVLYTRIWHCTKLCLSVAWTNRYALKRHKWAFFLLLEFLSSAVRISWQSAWQLSLNTRWEQIEWKWASWWG
jgi:hypothetical protein